MQCLLTWNSSQFGNCLVDCIKQSIPRLMEHAPTFLPPLVKNNHSTPPNNKSFTSSSSWHTNSHHRNPTSSPNICNDYVKTHAFSNFPHQDPKRSQSMHLEQTYMGRVRIIHPSLFMPVATSVIRVSMLY